MSDDLTYAGAKPGRGTPGDPDPVPETEDTGHLVPKSLGGYADELHPFTRETDEHGSYFRMHPDHGTSGCDECGHRSDCATHGPPAHPSLSCTCKRGDDDGQ